MSDEDIKLASTAMLLLKLATPRADLTVPERIKIALEVQIRIRLLEAKVSRMQQEIALHDDKLMELSLIHISERRPPTPPPCPDPHVRLAIIPAI